MVAALLSLRFRVLANTLNRNMLQLLAVIFGALQTVVILVIAIAGLAVLVIYPQPVQQATVVIGGVAVTLGWFLIPLIATGIEPTIDPLKLSAFPLSVTKLMVAMTLVGADLDPGHRDADRRRSRPRSPGARRRARRGPPWAADWSPP